MVQLTIQPTPAPTEGAPDTAGVDPGQLAGAQVP